MNIRTIIVDDEKLAREKIRRFLRDEDDVEIINECFCGTNAVKLINEHKPDLVFLDIQMPELDGFEVLQNIEPDKMPSIIFVTAYDKYAIQAFEVHALDYLLKPFDKERLQMALERARKHLEQGQKEKIDERLISLLTDLKTEKDYPDRLILKTAGRIYFVKTTDIDWIEAAGNYVKLHIGDTSHMLRETMTRIEEKLPSNKFLRIHRSRFVNVDRIKELNPLFSGDYLVTLQDGTEFTLSRNYHNRLKRLFEQFS